MLSRLAICSWSFNWLRIPVQFQTLPHWLLCKSWSSHTVPKDFRQQRILLNLSSRFIICIFVVHCLSIKRKCFLCLLNSVYPLSKQNSRLYRLHQEWTSSCPRRTKSSFRTSICLPKHFQPVQHFLRQQFDCHHWIWWFNHWNW